MTAGSRSTGWYIDADYASRYGQGVTHVHVVDIDRGNRQATLIADLTAEGSLPAVSYDCAIITQTLHSSEMSRRLWRTCARHCVQWNAAADGAMHGQGRSRVADI